MTNKFNAEQIEEYMKLFKLGSLAKGWAKIPFINKEQYITELLEFELRGREADRISKAVNSAGFEVVKTIDDFIWSNDINIPGSITRAEIETFSFVDKKENLILMGAVGTGKNTKPNKFG